MLALKFSVNICYSRKPGHAVPLSMCMQTFDFHGSSCPKCVTGLDCMRDSECSMCFERWVVQLRNLLWATSNHDVYIMDDFAVIHWDLNTRESTKVCCLIPCKPFHPYAQFCGAHVHGKQWWGAKEGHLVMEAVTVVSPYMCSSGLTAFSSVTGYILMHVLFHRSSFPVELRYNGDMTTGMGLCRCWTSEGESSRPLSASEVAPMSGPSPRYRLAPAVWLTAWWPPVASMGSLSFAAYPRKASCMGRRPFCP